MRHVWLPALLTGVIALSLPKTTSRVGNPTGPVKLQTEVKTKGNTSATPSKVNATRQKVVIVQGDRVTTVDAIVPPNPSASAPEPDLKLRHPLYMGEDRGIQHPIYKGEPFDIILVDKNTPARPKPAVDKERQSKPAGNVLGKMKEDDRKGPQKTSAGGVGNAVHKKK